MAVFLNNLKCALTPKLLAPVSSVGAKSFSSTSPDSSKKSWIPNFVRKIETPKDSSSNLLSDKTSPVVYELQFHAVKPERMEDYIKQFTAFNKMMEAKGTGAQLCGSFTTEFGEQDEAVHLWRYDGGYPVLNRAASIYRTDKDFIEFRVARNQMLRHRRNQIVLPFSFWPFMSELEGNHIYELRSYTLKPGTQVEWGNNWARGLKVRKVHEKPVAGLFSHIGQMYQVHHIWAYSSLESRREQREAAWSRPGWDDVVAYTVPLIKTLSSRIMVPTPFSPLK